MSYKRILHFDEPVREEYFQMAYAIKPLVDNGFKDMQAEIIGGGGSWAGAPAEASPTVRPV